MGPGGFFPTNPDLADILGRTDFDFEIFYLFCFYSKFPDFQDPKFPEIWLGRGFGPGLGRAGHGLYDIVGCMALACMEQVIYRLTPLPLTPPLFDVMTF